MTPEELKTRRKRLGLTQVGLAPLLGVDQRMISRWETGADAITAPRSLWLDQEMARVKREYKRPRGRPPKRRRAATARPPREASE